VKTTQTYLHPTPPGGDSLLAATFQNPFARKFFLLANALVAEQGTIFPLTTFIHFHAAEIHQEKILIACAAPATPKRGIEFNYEQSKTLHSVQLA
jgi:hypothetical protein